ncbi:hypothetical protein ACIGBL_34585 [Streptomyces sp. NPDC085614]|uniref:hypothetical protein n=1 Tax=Streptomyces sp. NPDC085614 TaxID=3365733 RepID=UPI0037CFCB87
MRKGIVRVSSVAAISLIMAAGSIGTASAINPAPEKGELSKSNESKDAAGHEHYRLTSSGLAFTNTTGALASQEAAKKANKAQNEYAGENPSCTFQFVGSSSGYFLFTAGTQLAADWNYTAADGTQYYGYSQFAWNVTC